ncbi:hypothetical protein PR048_029909 [Dryococelus australis]|uniref:HTH CENPB-type domain-containing protein n=1 Tax=Dryococelus australis TaxID=614101 RepID=A0ABQ9GAD7_9NEOP|nr:hypothetical protein PR048_029909 [Dryococelus australis]
MPPQRKVLCLTSSGKLKLINDIEKFPEPERCLVGWVEDRRANNIPVNGVLTKQKAHDFVEQPHATNFTDSNGWLGGVKTLPQNCKNNQMAWMTRDIFTDWLKGLKLQMKLGKRKFVLILDNCSGHAALPELDHVNVIFLPPNTTSILQPIYQTITKNIKLLLSRKEVVRLILYSIEQTSQHPDITKFSALRIARKAW